MSSPSRTVVMTPLRQELPPSMRQRRYTDPGRRDWSGVAEALRAAPGTWMLVSEREKSHALAETIRAGRGAFKPRESNATHETPGFEAESRKNEWGRYSVWAMFAGEPAPVESPAEHAPNNKEVTPPQATETAPEHWWIKEGGQVTPREKTEVIAWRSPESIRRPATDRTKAAPTVHDVKAKRDWSYVAAELRDHVDRFTGEGGWGIISTSEQNYSISQAIRAQRGAFSPTRAEAAKGWHFQAVNEKMPDGNIWVYARFNAYRRRSLSGGLDLT